MGPNLRALRLRLLVALVLAAAGFAVPARAQAPAGDPPPRLTTVALPADGAAGATTVRLPFPATHVGLRWQGHDDAAVEIRWQGIGEWGRWEPVPLWEDAGDHDAGVAASGLVRPAAGARRLVVRWPAGVAALEVVVIDAGQRPLPRRPVVNPSGPQQPEVISRHAWGADESMRKGPVEFAPISKLVVHHTVTPNDDPDPAQTVRAVYAYHTRHNKWNDIGYNFLVDQQGRIYEGRYARPYRAGEIPTGEDEAGRGVVGAHARGLNPGTVGVAVLGDYSGGYAPPGPALDAVVRLLAWKAGRHGIDPHGASPFTATDGSRRTFPNISGHRDVGQTGCPGGQLYERLPEIRQRVAGGGGAPSTPQPIPAPPPPPAPVPEFPGFWSVAADGQIRPFGDVRSSGDLAGKSLGGPIVSLASTPTGKGYWMVGADGGVFAFGDAPFLGAPAGQLRAPAVHLEPTPTGQGYWILSAAGEVVAFGDAGPRGQLFPVPATAVGLAGTPSGQGYWVATADGQVFAFGDAVVQAAT
ncbi:MAG TPA: N-acetylmuramoyl-L-alanine amidase, partial [Acidimicrobiia bacterium]|nr:N-acetylmuramoyl-L-alanine amidase [Acidimicrobiia bacterium]